MTLTVRRPRDAELVEAWSASAALGAVDRALALLAAFVDAPRERLAELSVGQRDTLLCDARAALFGAPLELVATCPACGERNSLNVDVRELPRCTPDDSPVVVGARRFRLPDSRDLAAVASEPDPERAARMLAQRCALDGAELDEATLAALDDALGERDAAAAVELRFACSSCAAATVAPFDAAAVLFAESTALVDRLLDDVHRLALAYGWSEDTILALPAARRERYLALVG